MYAKVGITGSRTGMTAWQHKALNRLLNDEWGLGRLLMEEFHHGDCLGVDATAHSVVYNLGYAKRIVLHPPSNSFMRAWTAVESTEVFTVLPPLPYLERNDAIVAAVDLLIAVPSYRLGQEPPRSGTYYTVRRARNAGKPVIIIQLDGELIKERIE